MQRALFMALLLSAGICLLPSNAAAAETIIYTYDAKGRLIRVEHVGGVNNNTITTYAYDKAGNRTNVTTIRP